MVNERIAFLAPTYRIDSKRLGGMRNPAHMAEGQMAHFSIDYLAHTTRAIIWRVACTDQNW